MGLLNTYSLSGSLPRMTRLPLASSIAYWPEVLPETTPKPLLVELDELRERSNSLRFVLFILSREDSRSVMAALRKRLLATKSEWGNLMCCANTSRLWGISLVILQPSLRIESSLLEGQGTYICSGPWPGVWWFQEMSEAFMVGLLDLVMGLPSRRVPSVAKNQVTGSRTKPVCVWLRAVQCRLWSELELTLTQTRFSAGGRSPLTSSRHPSCAKEADIGAIAVRSAQGKGQGRSKEQKRQPGATIRRTEDVDNGTEVEH